MRKIFVTSLLVGTILFGSVGSSYAGERTWPREHDGLQGAFMVSSMLSSYLPFGLALLVLGHGGIQISGGATVGTVAFVILGGITAEECHWKSLEKTIDWTIDANLETLETYDGGDHTSEKTKATSGKNNKNRELITLVENDASRFLATHEMSSLLEKLILVMRSDIQKSFGEAAAKKYSDEELSFATLKLVERM